MTQRLLSDIVYKTVGDQDIRLDLLLPDPLPVELAPLIVEIHGGGWISCEKNGMVNRAYAERGFITASIDYRLSPEWTHPAHIDDCRDAIRWLRTHAQQYAIDPQRIGVYGFSAGSHLAALLGTSGHVADATGDIPCSVQAVADLCGPADILPTECLLYEGDNLYEQFFGGPVADHLDAVKDASPVTFVGPNMPPFLIMHCADDVRIPVRHAEALRDALTAVGADVTTVIFPEGGHGFEGHFGGPIEKMMMDFFVKHLRPTSPGLSGHIE